MKLNVKQAFVKKKIASRQLCYNSNNFNIIIQD